jgi:hypothetical protein
MKTIKQAAEKFAEKHAFRVPLNLSLITHNSIRVIRGLTLNF